MDNMGYSNFHRSLSCDFPTILWGSWFVFFDVFCCFSPSKMIQMNQMTKMNIFRAEKPVDISTGSDWTSTLKTCASSDLRGAQNCCWEGDGFYVFFPPSEKPHVLFNQKKKHDTSWTLMYLALCTLWIFQVRRFIWQPINLKIFCGIQRSMATLPLPQCQGLSPTMYSFNKNQSHVSRCLIARTRAFSPTSNYSRVWLKNMCTVWQKKHHDAVVVWPTLYKKTWITGSQGA